MKVFLYTLGCKVNQFETGGMERLLLERGHEISGGPEGCDAIVINTCVVTAESERKSRQAVRKFAAAEPRAIIAVCGCFPQISPESAGKLGADLIYGSGDRHAFIGELERVFSEGIRSVRIDNALGRREFELMPSGNEAGRTRAMLKIEDGCSNYCSYCVIPYARGPVRSLPIKQALREAKDLKERGFGEIVLTGIEIASYGRDLPEKPSLTDLIFAVASAVPEVRIRLGSLEPRIVTDEFCGIIKALPNVCPHFHLSLQSGSDAVLRRMKRKYDTAGFYGSAELLRRYFPKCAVATDLIVGFPGETDAEFAETMSFIEKCRFSSMHIFPYSARTGTAAAGMPGQISKEIKKKRAQEAGTLAKKMEKSYLESCVGDVFEVLFEREKDGISYGHAPNYCETAAAGVGMRGKCMNVMAKSVRNYMLFGELCL